MISLYCYQLKTCCEIIINQLNNLEKRNCSLIELLEMNQNSQVLSDLNNKGHDEIVWMMISLKSVLSISSADGAIHLLLASSRLLACDGVIVMTHGNLLERSILLKEHKTAWTRSLVRYLWFSGAATPIGPVIWWETIGHRFHPFIHVANVRESVRIVQAVRAFAVPFPNLIK